MSSRKWRVPRSLTESGKSAMPFDAAAVTPPAPSSWMSRRNRLYLRIKRPSTRGWLKSIYRGLLRARDERGVASRRRGVHGVRAFVGEAEEIVRPARLGAGARKPLAAEGLHADGGADHVAVHIEVSRARARAHELHRLLDAAVHPHGEPVALA